MAGTARGEKFECQMGCLGRVIVELDEEDRESFREMVEAMRVGSMTELFALLARDWRSQRAGAVGWPTIEAAMAHLQSGTRSTPRATVTVADSLLTP